MDHQPQSESTSEADVVNLLISIGVLSDPGAIEADESLFERGLLDSLGIMSLVAGLQQRFDVKVDDRELLPGNFDSINAITDFVQRKRAA